MSEVVGRRIGRLSCYQLPCCRARAQRTVREKDLQIGRPGVVCKVANVDDEGGPSILLQQLDYADGRQYPQRVARLSRIRRERPGYARPRRSPPTRTAWRPRRTPIAACAPRERDGLDATVLARLAEHLRGGF
jgi:hypothetical protein